MKKRNIKLPKRSTEPGQGMLGLPTELRIYTEEQIIEAARTLFSPEDQGHTEYARGVCELIGRLQACVGGYGEGTVENAMDVALLLGVRIVGGKS